MTSNPLAQSRVRLFVVTTTVLLVLGGCTTQVTSPPAAPATPKGTLAALVEAMGQRLAVMPQVAEWKRANDKPVRDRPRELQVLDEAVQDVNKAAEEDHVPTFPEAAVRHFYQAQIDTAVAIQDQVLSRPAKAGAKPPDLETVIRPELDRLGAQIADLLVKQTEAPKRSRLERLAREYWKVEGLEPSARLRLVDALERLLRTPRSVQS